MTKRAFTFKDDKSDKFWWTEYEADSLVINHGKTNASGKYQIKEFDNETETEKEAEKLIAQKVRKGYIETDSFDFDNHYYFDDEEVGLHPKTSHPNFRQHFVNDLYYDCCDEEAPFGSDEGSDTLYELTEFIKKNKKINICDFPKYLIETIWDMKYIPVEDIDEEHIKKLSETDETNLIQSDMITYATAFGQIKITGRIDKQLKENAIKSMQRMEVYHKTQGYEISEISKILIKDLSSFNRYQEPEQQR